MGRRGGAVPPWMPQPDQALGTQGMGPLPGDMSNGQNGGAEPWARQGTWEPPLAEQGWSGLDDQRGRVPYQDNFPVGFRPDEPEPPLGSPSTAAWGTATYEAGMEQYRELATQIGMSVIQQILAAGQQVRGSGGKGPLMR